MSGARVVEETFPLGFSGRAVALARIESILLSDRRVEIRQVTADEQLVRRSYRPLWAMIAAVVLAVPTLGLSLLLLLVHRREIVRLRLLSTPDGLALEIRGTIREAALLELYALGSGEAVDTAGFPALYGDGATDAPMGGPAGDTAHGMTDVTDLTGPDAGGSALPSHVADHDPVAPEWPWEPHLSAEEQHAARQPLTPTADDQHVTADDQHVTADDQHVTADDQYVAAQPLPFSAEKQHVTADPQHLTPDPQHLTLDPQRLTAEEPNAFLPAAETDLGDLTVRRRATSTGVTVAEAVAPTSAYVLEFDTGIRIVVGHLVLIGRDPARAQGEEGATLVPVEDPERSVSKTHLAISAAADGVWIVDRHSTNGVELVTDGAVRRVPPGARVLATRGTTVRFGERRLDVT